VATQHVENGQSPEMARGATGAQKSREQVLQYIHRTVLGVLPLANNIGESKTHEHIRRRPALAGGVRCCALFHWFYGDTQTARAAKNSTDF
jgi:hypothetical protein